MYQPVNCDGGQCLKPYSVQLLPFALCLVPHRFCAVCIAVSSAQYTCPMWKRLLMSDRLLPLLQLLCRCTVGLCAGRC